MFDKLLEVDFVLDFVAVVVLENEAVDVALGMGLFVRENEMDGVPVLVPVLEKDTVFELETDGEVVLEAVLVREGVWEFVPGGSQSAIHDPESSPISQDPLPQ